MKRFCSLLRKATKLENILLQPAQATEATDITKTKTTSPIFVKFGIDLSSAINEFSVLRHLYASGCAVPKPIGIVTSDPDGNLMAVSDDADGSVLQTHFHSDKVAIAMERVGNQDLFEVVVQDKVTHRHVAKAVQLAYSAAHSINAVHNAGVVHGDVKLENLVMGPSGKVYVIDFESDGFTAEFLPPGPFVHKSLQTDAWMLGVVIYFLVVSIYNDDLKLPDFRSDHGIRQIHAVLLDSPASIKAQIPDVEDRHLSSVNVAARVAARLLNPNPLQRWTVTQTVLTLSIAADMLESPIAN